MNTDPENTNNRCRFGRHNFARYALIVTLCLTTLLTTLSSSAQAHEGPPFPIIVDAEVGPWLVSVWTDPDIGTGTFFVVFEAASGVDPSAIELVRIGVEPVSGRLDEVVYTAEPQSAGNATRYYTEVQFDQGEMWNIRIAIDGDGWGGELHSEVEATPDGIIGPIGLVLYLLPFLAVGGLWARAIILRRKQE